MFHKILSLVFLSSACTIASAAEPVRLIFDTDIGNDVDDVLAMGMIHALQSRGECELLAVTITKDNKLAAPFVDAVNTFYGRGDIPIGVCRNSSVTPDDGKFNPLVSIQDEGKDRFPHDLRSGADAESAVAVLRRTLASQPDQGVVIAQVGFSTNLADLLQSKADDYSKLNGVELMAQKVKFVSIMAGAFEKIPGDRGGYYHHREYNVEKDIPSCKKLVELCPVPIIWSGFEIGIALPYPHVSIERDFEYVPHHPLKEAYYAYEPPPHDRPTWDLTSVLYAVRPDRGYFSLSHEGDIVVTDEGLTLFQMNPQGKHRYLKVSQDQRIRTIEALQDLSSQPK
jgi:hypothetical protein